MRRFLTTVCAMALVALMTAAASAEKTVAVNDPALPGVFDQPSAAVSGSVVHVAYIGADNTAGPFGLFYAAINGKSDFTKLDLSRTTEGFFVTSPTAVEEDVVAKYGVRVIGRSEDIKERFYAISAERRIKHPAVVTITETARSQLFTTD